MFIPDTSNKRCFAPCHKDVVDSGMCSCHNRIKSPMDTNWEDFMKEHKIAMRDINIDLILKEQNPDNNTE